MSKQFLIIIIVVVVGLFGILSLTKKKDETSQSNSNSSVSASEHVTGKIDSQVRLIEYGDFQCPACKSYFPMVEEIKNTYSDKIAFQFRHYPLNQIHPNAFIGSRAAEAASNQDKFWEMYSLLYENQSIWSNEKDPTNTLVSYAEQLNLDTEKFKTDMNSSNTGDIINADIKAGQEIGVNSTPTFVLNGKKLDKNPTSIDEFKQLIDEELAKIQ